MRNSNILEGMACPTCGAEGPFIIRAHVLVLIDDDGVIDDLSGAEFEHDDACQCDECDHAGTVGSFTTERKG